MLFVSMDPPAVRTLATALRTQATAADETASRIQTALWLSELSSLVPDRLTARAETWRTAAGVLETRATLAESFHINLLPSGSEPASASVAPESVTDDAALATTYQRLIGMSDGERADAVAAMSDEELAGILDFASDLPADDGALAALLLPVIDDERVEGWAAGLEDVHSITDLNEAIANWNGSDNDPILDQLISDRNALIFALTGDSETWRYDPAIAALAEMLGVEYEQAESQLDANRIHDLTTQIDGWPGTDNDPILDELIAERDALLDKWIAADTFPPEIAAVALPLLTVAEIVQVEQRHPNTVSIAALDHIVASHDAAALPGDPLDREIEKLRDVRDALVASMAGTDSAIGLDVNVASVAQLNGISYEEAEQGLLVGRIEGQTNDLQFLPDGPVRSAMLAERDELVAQLVGGNELLTQTMAGFLDSGYSVNEAYTASVELLQGEIEAAELAASMNDEDGFFSGIPGGVQVGDIADGLWDGLKASLGDAWGLVTGVAGFLWNAVTNPTEIDDMVAEQWDTAMELVDMIWGAIMSGDVEMIVEEILLPIFGINMDDLRERGLDYALAFALGSNPDLLLTGGAAAFAKIENLRDLGRLADGADALDGNGIDLDTPDLDAPDFDLDLDNPDLLDIADLDPDLDLADIDDIDVDVDFDTTPVINHGLPDSWTGHKADRWAEYQARGGEWPPERWSVNYEQNQVRALNANARELEVHTQLGWGETQVAVDIDVDGLGDRRFDIADAPGQRGVEHKSGDYTTQSPDIRNEIAKDAWLVAEEGWAVHWIFDGTISKPLADALTAAGITYEVGFG